MNFYIKRIIAIFSFSNYIQVGRQTMGINNKFCFNVSEAYIRRYGSHRFSSTAETYGIHTLIKLPLLKIIQ